MLGQLLEGRPILLLSGLPLLGVDKMRLVA